MPDYETIAVGATRAGLSEMRTRAWTPELVDRLADVAHALAHAVNDQLQAEGDRERRYLPVCKEGCSWCCHTDVVATPPEVLRIARHLQETRGPEELASLRARLEALAARTREMTHDAWRREKIPCPFLDVGAGSCTIHHVRPMVCRAYNSLDVSKCVKQYESGDERDEVPANVVQQRSMNAVGIGLGAACRLHGLEWEWVGLTAGVAAALAEPDAARRWLEGAAVLKGAHTKTSRMTAPRHAADVDLAVRRVQTAHAGELPARAAPASAAKSEEDARRERNRRKRERRGR